MQTRSGAWANAHGDIEMDKTDAFLGKLDELAKAGAELEQIQKQTTDQEVEALGKIVNKMLPVMRFIDYRIKVHGHRPGHQFGQWEYEYYEEKGLNLVSNTERHATDKDYRGEYRGDFLVLTRSGKWLRFDQSGDWSNWQDEGSHFQNEPTEIDITKVVQKYGFSEVISGLSESFKDALEKAENKKQQLGSRMNQLQQIKGILEA